MSYGCGKVDRETGHIIRGDSTDCIRRRKEEACDPGKLQMSVLLCAVIANRTKSYLTMSRVPGDKFHYYLAWKKMRLRLTKRLKAEILTLVVILPYLPVNLVFSQFPNPNSVLRFTSFKEEASACQFLPYDK